MSLACSPISRRRWLGWKRAASICRSGCGIPFSHAIEAGTVSVSESPGPHQADSELARAGSRRHASVRMGDDTSRAVDRTSRKAVSEEFQTSGTSTKRHFVHATCYRTDIAHFQRSEEHTSELQSLRHLVCRLLLEK